MALLTYEKELLEWNQKFNLTAIRDVESIRIKHFLDSFSCVLAWGPNPPSSLIDVGTGAGFPGLALKILYPNMNLTLVESVGKKVTFCRHIVSVLGLEHVHVVKARAEELGHHPHHREKYDWAVARAVANLNVLSEYLLPQFKMPKTGEEVKLLVTITINKEAWPTVRADSHFFINLAGVIGEKFLEISPGTMDQAALEPGQVVRGEDPPRIDQMISQSYALAGKILEFVNKNEGSVVQTVETMNKLVVNFDKMLKQLEKTSRDPEVHKIVKNLSTIMDDGAYFSQRLRSPEGQKFMIMVMDLMKRLEPLDAKAIKKFLQEEGIRARLF